MYEQFDYRCPTETEELWELLKVEGSLIFGGGTDLLVFLRDKKLSAKHIVDVKGIPSFREIRETADSIRIGAAVTMTQIEESPLVQKWASALCQGASRVGSVQIRNKATLAGNIQTASPAGDGYNAAWGLDGRVVLWSAAGERTVPLDQFVFFPKRTDLQPGEVIAAVEIPKKPWTFQRFFKVGRRNALAISVVNGMVALQETDGIITDARISVGAVGPTPVRIPEAERLLWGKVLTEALAEEAAEIVRAKVQPISDLRASAEYRKYMAGTMIKRTLMASMEESK